MKSLRNIPLLIALGCFLCVNGTSCLQCVLAIGCQLFHPGHHTHDLDDACPGDEHPACPHDGGSDCGHWHNCPDPQSHARVVSIALDSSEDFKTHDVFSTIGAPAHPALRGDRYPDSSPESLRWSVTCGTCSDMPLFLRYEQLLI